MGNSSAQIFTQFNADARKKYIEGLKKTYLGVLLSTELNSKTSKIKEVKTQIETLINHNNEDEIKGDITIGGKKVNVTLTRQNNNTYSVKFDENHPEIAIKNTGDYTTENLLTLCGRHELTVSKDKKGNNVFSVTIKGEDKGKNTTVGGPGKISIFTQHLSYIKETIEHLEKGGNPTKEFALATGTGKTFIELILEYLPARLIGTRYVSVAPDESLITQKRSDWKKFLSDGDINDIELNEISGEKGCSILTTKGLINNWDQFLKAIGLEQLPGIIDALKIGNKTFEIKNGKINVDGKDFVILADKIQLGDEEYKIENGKVKIHDQEFELDVTKSVFATFDEEHRIVFEELYKGCMGFVSILCKTLFLSATPSQKTYESVKECGGLLKTLSLMEKMKSGAFGLLEFIVHQKQRGDLVDNYIEELEKAVTFKEKPEEGKQSFYHKPQTTLTGEELKKDIEIYVFHNMENVLGESALILAETSALKDKLRKKATHNIFTDESNSGNHSSTVGQKRDAIIDHLSEIYGSRNSAVIREVVNSNLDYKSEIHDYSAFRVMHGVIENTLSCSTGLSRIELDEARFSDLEGLVNKVKTALESGNYNLSEYVTDQGIKSDTLRNEIIQQMHSVIEILKANTDKDLFIRLVRNWNQDKKLHTMMPIDNIPGNQDEILKLFGITGSSNLTFGSREERKSNSIFQSLKDTYEIEGTDKKDGNITKIEKECEESYARLREAEQKRQKHYNKHIQPLIAKLDRTIPEQHHWCPDVSGLAEYSPKNFNEKNRLSEGDKQRLEKDLSHIQSQINLQEKRTEYVTLKQAVKTAKGELVANFGKIKTEFSNRKQYPLAPLRPFSTKNRYIEGNSEDDDAQLRMGLCGNCADENYYPSQNTERKSRIQGFNAIDLQHVVMLVDEKSNFINDPRQLIQGPGRLRCLNRARLSTLFCHSSEKLKFDIELLKKGDYIEAFNKAMEEYNKKSPEELGDEILRIIDKLIEDGVSDKIKQNEKFEEIDDLAAEVIDQVISFYEIVYNNKGHNAEKTQDYFAKVLEYVTSKVEKQLKRAGVVVGNLDIEHNIRGIQSKIDKIESQIKGEVNIANESQASDRDHVRDYVQSKVDDIVGKINQNTQDKEETDKKLEVKGNIIKRFFVKLWRFIRRLIGLRIGLEKEKIKLVEKGNDLNQEKVKVEQEKSEFEAKTGAEEEKIDPKARNEKLLQDKTKLEQEKLELEAQRSSKEKQKFIGIVKKKENVEEKKIDPKEREDIITKQKAYNAKLLEDKLKELAKIEKEDGASLTELQKLQDKIKKFESIKAGIESCLIGTSGYHSSGSRHSTSSGFEALKAKISGLKQHEDEKTEIEKIVKKLDENIQKLKDVEDDKINESANQTLLKEIKGDLEKLQTERARLEEVAKKKSGFEEEKVKLETISSYKENSVGYNDYYNNVVNQELAKKSIERNYNSVQIYWISEIFTKFEQVFNREYYKVQREGFQQHIRDCVEGQAFLELFSNTFVPLMNSGMLSIALDACYPGVNNAEKVEKINEYYNILIENQTDKEVNSSDIEHIVEYIEKVQNYINDIKQGSASYYDSAGIEAALEMTRLEKKEELKVRSDIYECILTPIKSRLDHSHSSARHWVGSNPSQQEIVACAADQVGTELRNLRPLTIGAVISPDVKSLNPIQERFPQGEVRAKLDGTISQQWCGEKLRARG